jgi:hypothetical protein
MSKIPQSLAIVMNKISEEVTWLHGRWRIYCQLFAESPRRIELLSQSAPIFFFILEDVLVGEIQIMLSKLTTKALLVELHAKCEPFRDWRNKVRTHLDLNTALKSTRMHSLTSAGRWSRTFSPSCATT